MAVNKNGESEPLVTKEAIKAKYPFGKLGGFQQNTTVMIAAIAHYTSNFEQSAYQQTQLKSALLKVMFSETLT